MHQLLENTLATESADPAFEQRMVSRFRDKIPAPNGGSISFFTGLMRMRAAQITAVAALLLTLVQVGRMVTGEGEALGRPQRAMAFASASMQNEGKVEATAHPSPLHATTFRLHTRRHAPHRKPPTAQEVHRDRRPSLAKTAESPVAPAPAQTGDRQDLPSKVLRPDRS